MMPAVFDLGYVPGRDPLCEEPGLRAQVWDALGARVVDVRLGSLTRPMRRGGDRLLLCRSSEAYFDGSGRAGSHRTVLHAAVLGVSEDEVDALQHNALEGAWGDAFVRRLRGDSDGFGPVRTGAVYLAAEDEELERAVYTAVELGGAIAGFTLVANRDHGVRRVLGTRVYPSEATGWTAPP